MRREDENTHSPVYQAGHTQGRSPPHTGCIKAQDRKSTMGRHTDQTEGLETSSQIDDLADG